MLHKTVRRFRILTLSAASKAWQSIVYILWTAVLPCWGGARRDVLVLTPLAELIPLTISPQALLTYVRELTVIIDSLADAGYLHADLSYYNLLFKDGKPLLVDMQTLLSTAQVISHSLVTSIIKFAK